jgi:uncharacterized protein YecT (DUF1311 family)
MIHGILLVAATATPCEAAQTQLALDACWSDRATQAISELQATYARVTAEMRTLGIDPRPLVGVQAAWVAARDATCAFEESLYEGGSIAPMIKFECVDRMTRARTNRLREGAAVIVGRAAPPVQPLSKSAAVELDRVYGLLNKRITPASQKTLASSELAWIAYRDKACKLERGGCLTELETERTAELKSGWIGEPFW